MLAVPDVQAASEYQCFFAPVQIQSTVWLFTSWARGAIESLWTLSFVERCAGAVAAPRFSVGFARLAYTYSQAANIVAPFSAYRAGAITALANPDQDTALAR